MGAKSSATGARTTADLTQPEPFHWVRQQRLRCCEEADGMRQGRVQFKGGFIHSLRMDREDARFPHRLKHIDPQTADLGTRRFIDPKQLITKYRFFSRQRFEADNKMKRQAMPPVNEYACPLWADDGARDRPITSIPPAPEKPLRRRAAGVGPFQLVR